MNGELDASYLDFKRAIERCLPGTFAPEDLEDLPPHEEKKESVESIASRISSLLVVSGPSGVGKGTLINKLMVDHGSKFGFSVSHTTRGPRPGEEEGVHYHFVERVSLGGGRQFV